MTDSHRNRHARRAPRLILAAAGTLVFPFACSAGGPGTAGASLVDASSGGDTGVSTPGSEGGVAADVTSMQDAAVTGDSDGRAGDANADATFVTQCLPDGHGQLTLVTAGGVALDVNQGNDGVDCSLGSGPLNMIDGTGYTLGTDAPLTGGSGKRLLVYIAVPGALNGATGSYGVTLEIQTYSDAVNLTDAKQWSGNCTIDITMNQRIATNPMYWTYEATGSVTCSTALSSKANDGGAGSDAPLQVTMLTFVTRYDWL